MAYGDNFYCFCHLTNNYTTVRCNPEHPHCSIRKLVRLLETTNMEQEIERKNLLLYDFLTSCANGFWMRDIPFVCRFIELTLTNETYLTHFYEPLGTVLYLLAVPPMLISSAEILSCRRDLTEYFNFLTYVLMEYEDKHIKDLVLRALWCLLDNRSPPEKRCVPLELRQAVAGESFLAECLAEILRNSSEQDYEMLLHFALLFSEVSEAAGSSLIKNGVIGTVMLRMEPNWSSRNRNYPPTDFINSGIILNCDISLKLLWALLTKLKNYSQKSLDRIQPIDQQSFWSFRYAFQILQQTKHYETERNHCLMIILLCLQYLPDSAFVQSGLIYNIAEISIHTQITSRNTKMNLTQSDVDFQFKKMAIFALYYSVDNYSALAVYHDHNIIKHLLNSMMPETKVIWTQEQQKTLTVTTLAVLQRFAVHFSEEFIENDVCPSLLMLIEYYFQALYDVEVILALLKCLYFTKLSVTDNSNDIIIENMMTDVAVYFLSQKQLLQIHHSCLNYCFCILSIVPANGSNLVIVKLGAEYMKRTLDPTSEDFPWDPTTMICLFNLFWISLLTNEENLKCFIQIGAVYTLLDLIETNIFPIKLVGLGLLTDLCEEGSCIPHLLTWRSKGKTLISLLMSVFREECGMVRVKIDENGILQDIEKPIMGVRQYTAMKDPNKSSNSSPAIVDFILSSRPKIYAILQLLKYRHNDIVELVNNQYRLQNQPLSHKDQITKLLAENYLQFKLGEVWCEINIDLQNIGWKPLEVDGCTMETLIRKHYHLSLNVKEIQEKILKHKAKEDKISEYMVYKMLKESKLCSALCALKELDYMARVTEHMIRHLKKSVQKTQIDESLVLVENKNNIHRTFMRNIGVTFTFGLMANIQNNNNKEDVMSNEENDLECASLDAPSNVDVDNNSVK